MLLKRPTGFGSYSPILLIEAMGFESCHPHTPPGVYESCCLYSPGSLRELNAVAPYSPGSLRDLRAVAPCTSRSLWGLRAVASCTPGSLCQLSMCVHFLNLRRQLQNTSFGQHEILLQKLTHWQIGQIPRVFKSKYLEIQQIF